MFHGRVRVAAEALALALALTGAAALKACGGNGSAVTTTGRTPTVMGGSTPATPGTTPASARPTSGWGPEGRQRARTGHRHPGDRTVYGSRPGLRGRGTLRRAVRVPRRPEGLTERYDEGGQDHRGAPGRRACLTGRRVPQCRRAAGHHAAQPAVATAAGLRGHVERGQRQAVRHRHGHPCARGRRPAPLHDREHPHHHEGLAGPFPSLADQANGTVLDHLTVLEKTGLVDFGQALVQETTAAELPAQDVTPPPPVAPQPQVVLTPPGDHHTLAESVGRMRSGSGFWRRTGSIPTGPGR